MSNASSLTPSEDLYWRLHSLSKILEGSGVIDELQHPDAYSTILDAMAFVRGTPQPADCTRSHPHEDMSGYCLLRTEIARLANENARVNASQPVVREPLTDEQIAEMMRETWGCASIAPRHAMGFARAIEAAARARLGEQT